MGRELACQLGYAFIDLDRVIEARQGRSIGQIFIEAGEEAFRAAERGAAAEVLNSPSEDCVLAMGGGALAQDEIARLLESRSATTVFLDAPALELYQRCVDSLDAGARPLLKEFASFKKLYADRLPVYRRAHWHVDTSGRTVAEIASEIAGRVRDAQRERQRTNP